ncbi:MAG: GWxTD domain-containing protein [candidate division KSB1 bacterium]|nr:GWxTD domain-containing protein [candidate division KSB1 bacterium]
MKFMRYCLAAMLFGATILSADDESDQARQIRFYFSADYASFRAADSLVYLEFYAALDRKVLTFKRLEEEGNKFAAEFLVEAEISRQGQVLQNRIWRSRDTLDSLDTHALNMTIPIIGAFTVPPDEYQLELRLTDLFGENRRQSVKFPIRAVSYQKGLVISDLQLAMSIERDAAAGSFTKNGFKVLPHPAAVYGIGMPILYCYAEIYNLAPGESEEGRKYSVTYRVLDSDGKEAKTFPAQVRSKPGESSVLVQNLNVVTLVSGTYQLEVKVRDHQTGAEAKAAHRFFVYRPDDFAAGGAAFQAMEKSQGQGSPGIDADRYDVMKEEELDLEFDWVRYIAKPEELSTWKKLNLAGKREFIKEFWAARDATPGTPINEFKEEYLARVRMANALYRGPFKDGYKGDRGRVLLLYGKPDEIERFPSSSDAREYQIWHYYSIQGGVDFIFVDKRSMNDLELVHSTARGEIYDPDWMRFIDVNY